MYCTNYDNQLQNWLTQAMNGLNLQKSQLFLEIPVYFADFNTNHLFYTLRISRFLSALCTGFVSFGEVLKQNLNTEYEQK